MIDEPRLTRVLGSEAREMLAAWCTQKALLLDIAKQNARVPVELRRRFRDSQAPVLGSQVWVAPYAGGGNLIRSWPQSIRLHEEGPPELMAISARVGYFAFVVYLPLAPQMLLHVEDKGRLRQIWPRIDTSFIWAPTNRRLSEAEFERLGNSNFFFRSDGS